MVTVSHVVQNVLSRQVLLQEAINTKIVSYNKVAKYLKPKIEAVLDKPVKNSAVVMAIKRNSDKMQSNLMGATSHPSIETIKNDIFEIVLEESPTLLGLIKDLYHTVDFGDTWEIIDIELDSFYHYPYYLLYRLFPSQFCGFFQQVHLLKF